MAPEGPRRAGRADSAARRRARKKQLGAGGLALVALAALLGFGIAGSVEPGESPVWVYWAVGGFLALCFGIAAFGVYRRARPPRLDGLELLGAPGEARRGEEVGATVALTRRPREGARFEAGLVCTEIYDIEVRTRRRNGTQRTRTTREATAHEQWCPLEEAIGEQRVAFAVPSGAPFSHEGRCLSFAWALAVREVRPRRLDPRRDHPLWVLP